VEHCFRRGYLKIATADQWSAGEEKMTKVWILEQENGFLEEDNNLFAGEQQFKDIQGNLPCVIITHIYEFGCGYSKKYPCIGRLPIFFTSLDLAKEKAEQLNSFCLHRVKCAHNKGQDIYQWEPKEWLDHIIRYSKDKGYYMLLPHNHNGPIDWSKSRL